MKRQILTVSAVFILAGCAGSGKTMVVCAPEERHAAQTYLLREGKSTVGCDEAIKHHFAQEVRNGLSEAGMPEGNDLTIEYRFIQFDEGSRFVRYMAGGLGNAGEGEMTLEVTFKNKDNTELSKIHVGGKITAGFFGGSFDNAVEQSAKQVVRYVLTNFKA